jgi:hypothetical protein
MIRCSTIGTAAAPTPANIQGLRNSSTAPRREEGGSGFRVQHTATNRFDESFARMLPTPRGNALVFEIEF